MKSKKETDVFIYLLRDGSIPLYVGATIYTGKRLQEHYRLLLKDYENKANVKMQILEIAESLEVAAKKEKKWILYFKSRGFLLLNKTEKGYSRINLSIQEKTHLVTRVAEGDKVSDVSKSTGFGIRAVEQRFKEIRKEYGARNIQHLVYIFHQKKLIK